MKEAHEDAVREVVGSLPEAGRLRQMADLFKLLGDDTRVRLLQALAIRELCVCDLGEILGVTQSAVSHQLRLLRAARLVKYRKQGKQVFYSLDDDHVETLMAQGMAHLAE